MCKLPAMCVLLLGFHSDSFMTRLKMYGQIALLCEFSLSLIAIILNTFMYRLNMSCQITLLCSLMATMTTNILDTLMYRLNMSCQTTIFCKLFPTLITSILDTFISRVQNNFFFDFWKVLLISGVSNLTNDVLNIKNWLSPTPRSRRLIEIYTA